MILLDTCALFWLEHDPERLSPAARSAIASLQSPCFASSISALELRLRVARGKLELPLSPDEWLQEVCRRRAIAEIPVDFSIAGRSALLPRIHDDPFDRILIATALEKSFRIVTPDKLIFRYGEIEVIW